MPTSLRLTGFSGEVPRLIPTLLPDTAAQRASNVLVTSGGLRPINSPLPVNASLAPPLARSLFKMYDDGVDYWLSWADVVDAVRLPIAGDTKFKVAFTSSGFEPRVTDLQMATSASPHPASWYVLGVTPPVTAPSLSAAGGSGPVEARAYVYTFVDGWGSESAPSPVSAIVSSNTDGTWSLAGLDTAPLNSYSITSASWAAGVLVLSCPSTKGLRAGEFVTTSGFDPPVLNASWKVLSTTSTQIRIAMNDPGTIVDGIGVADRDAPHNTTGMKKRVYRTVSSSAGSDYYFCVEVPADQTAVDDGTCSVAGNYTKAACAGAAGVWTDTGAGIGEPLQTTGWLMPPVDMHSLAVLPSGAMVGISGNEICFSEPLAVYAWPTGYRLTMDHPGVGLGVFGTSVVAATTGEPYLVNGVEPASMSAQKISQPWPCLSKLGIVSLYDGVAYPTSNGLAFVGNQRVQILTEGLFTKAGWAEMVPQSMAACVYDNKYMASYETESDGGVISLNLDDGTVTRFPIRPNVMYGDATSGRVYYVPAGGNYLLAWNSDIGARETIDWWSRKFVVPTPVSLGAAKVKATFSGTEAEIQAAQAIAEAAELANAALIAAGNLGSSLNAQGFNSISLNGSLLQPVPFVGFEELTFSVYSNDELLFTKQLLPGNTGAFRLPGGLKYDTMSFRINGNVPVDYFIVAETMDGLRDI